MATGIPVIVERMEAVFGNLEHGWTSTPETDKEVQIVEFRNGRVPYCCVLSTLGLSSVHLDSAVSEKKIRQELFVMSKADQLDGRIASALDQLARERVKSKSAILRGDVIQKQGSVIKADNFPAFYATLPIYFPEELWTIHDDRLGDIVLSWLLPIRKTELDFIKENGWRAFEERVDAAKFELFDFNRPDLA
jgi:hypothetical protein